VVVFEVPGDGVSAGVEALGEELSSLGQDRLGGLVADPAR
jgi:hypothetical protein